jgi:hypothetical protein
VVPPAKLTLPFFMEDSELRGLLTAGMVDVSGWRRIAVRGSGSSSPSDWGNCVPAAESSNVG